ncbi:MAG: hypothetical protein KIT60_05715 [Burkholderiaceae bacterium]|nr:hypothetical protein [Burkholderiaceae bacterium]
MSSALAQKAPAADVARAQPPRFAGASFPRGAHGRLLPLSVPMRFFGAAVAFHVLAWIALAFGAPHVPRYAGGIGWPLAALHALTLGVFVMAAIGASLQLMPVATRQALVSRRAVSALWWLYTPGVAALVVAIGMQRPLWMAGAAVPVAAALILYMALLARNLAGARGMAGVRTMGWLALAALALALLSALGMVATWAGWGAWPRPGLLMLHITMAVFGFMGLLALGLSNVLVPMFALAPVPQERTQAAIAALCALALALTVPVALQSWPPQALAWAIASAAAATAWHVASMHCVLRQGLRRELGGSFRLVRLAWTMLGVTWALAAWWAFDPARDGLATALIASALLGWLASFLFGILQRIVPFLVAMHLGGTVRRAPTPSSLTDERALSWHRRVHGAALGLLALAFALDSAAAALAAALAGTLGALAFAAFFVTVLRRTARARAAAGAPRA